MIYTRNVIDTAKVFLLLDDKHVKLGQRVNNSEAKIKGHHLFIWYYRGNELLVL